MFERFTERARQVVVLAHDEARGIGDEFIGLEHLLLGLLREDGAAARVLETHGIAVEPTRTTLCRGRPKVERPPAGQIPFTPDAKKTLEIGLREAVALGSASVGPEHLLLSLVQARDGAAAEILGAAGVDREAVLAGLPDASVQVGEPPPSRTGSRYGIVVLTGAPAEWPAQLDRHGAALGRLVTIAHVDDAYHAVFERRP